MPRKTFVAGEILTASDVNTNLMDQSVMVFDDATARTTAIPTPVEGMVTYLKDTNAVEKFDGSNFVGVATAPAILQVVQTVKTDTFTTSSATFTTVTGLTASITPSSASSKVLITAQISTGLGAAFGHFKVTRGGTDIYRGDAGGTRIQGVYGGFTNADVRAAVLANTIVFLDSPSTTGAVTYQVETRIGASGSVFVNRGDDDSEDANKSRGASSITLMEVAG